MLVIGQKEVDENKVSIRSRKDGDIGTLSLDEFIDKLLEEIKNKK